MMKRFRTRQAVLLILFAALLAAGFWANDRTAGAERSLYIFTCRPYGTQFTKEAMERAKKAGYTVGYRSDTVLPAQSYRASKQVRVVGTNEDYPYLAERRMKAGAWFNGLHAERGSCTAVLNEAAALEFFGTTQAQMNPIQIEGVMYTVLGVVREEEEEAAVYIPYENLQARHKKGIEIQQVFSRLDNESEARLLMQLSGMEDGGAETFSMEAYQTAAALRWQLILFLIAILTVVWLGKGIRTDWQSAALQGRRFLQLYYGTQIWNLCKERTFLAAVVRLVSRAALLGLVGYAAAGFFHGGGPMRRMGVPVAEFAYLEQWNQCSLGLFYMTVLAGVLLLSQRPGQSADKYCHSG